MAPRWNAKGDAAATVIMWIGTLMAVIICVVWIVQNVTTEHIVIEKVDSDMRILQGSLSSACNMEYYRFFYNPQIKEGHLIINDYDICLDTNPCNPVYYDSENEPRSADGGIRVENATLCLTPKNCQALYYTGDLAAQEVGSDVAVEEAVLCDDPSIYRCRLLLCPINNHYIINLASITYVAIEKNGTYRVWIQ